MKHNLFIITLLFCLFSLNSFAKSDEFFAEKCWEVGKKRILLQAEAWGCDVDIEEMEVNYVDNRWYNPSKYVWYQVLGECNGFDRVIVLVQHTSGSCIQRVE